MTVFMLLFRIVLVIIISEVFNNIIFTIDKHFFFVISFKKTFYFIVVLKMFTKTRSF